MRNCFLKWCRMLRLCYHESWGDWVIQPGIYKWRLRGTHYFLKLTPGVLDLVGFGLCWRSRVPVATGFPSSCFLSWFPGEEMSTSPSSLLNQLLYSMAFLLDFSFPLVWNLTGVPVLRIDSHCPQRSNTVGCVVLSWKLILRVSVVTASVIWVEVRTSIKLPPPPPYTHSVENHVTQYSEPMNWQGSFKKNYTVSQFIPNIFSGKTRQQQQNKTKNKTTTEI